MLIDVQKNNNVYEVTPNANPGGETYPPMVSSQMGKMKYNYTVTVTFPPTDIGDVSVMMRGDEYDTDMTNMCFRCAADKYAGFDFDPYEQEGWSGVDITLGDTTYELTRSMALSVINNLGTYDLIPEKQ